MISEATRQMIACLPAQWHEHYQERAAILEFDCKMLREESEELAWADTTGAMLKFKVQKIAQHQRANAAPAPLTIPRIEPTIGAKDRAAGEVEV